MSLKDKWKNAGKGIGHAFGNFGKAVGTTAKVAFGKEEKVDEDGNSVMKETWRNVGKGFGDAGKNIGSAAVGTVEKLEEKVEDDPKDKDVVDAEVVEEEKKQEE